MRVAGAFGRQVAQSCACVPPAAGVAAFGVGFAAALGRDVTAVEVPRAEWEQRFRREGMLHPEARIRMLDGFNEGWIDFQHEGAERRKGTVELAQVLSELAAGV